MAGPVFLGGCPRSGTTALWNALTKHPHFTPREGAHRDKELWFLAEFFEGRNPALGNRRSHVLDEIYVREYLAFLSSFLSNYCGSKTGRFVTAQTENILYAEQIVKLLPEARVVLTIRHPQENAWSLLNSFFSNWIRKNKSAELIEESEAIKAAQIWKDRAQVVLRALAGELGPHVTVVRQERMISDPAAVAREVLAFLGEAYEPAVARAMADTVINTSFPPGREPTEKSFYETVAVEKPGQREAFFAENRERLAASDVVCSAVQMVAGEEMKLLGYKDVRTTTVKRAAVSTAVVAAPARHVELKEVKILGKNGVERTTFKPGEVAVVRVTAKANLPWKNVSIAYHVRAEDGTILFGTTTFDERVMLPDVPAGGTLVVRLQIPVMVRQGKYGVTIALNSVTARDYGDNVLHHQIDEVAAFVVERTSDRPVHHKFVVNTVVESEVIPGSR